MRDHVAEAILDAAAAVFAERGEAASMADVAEAAGVGRATLYRYFPSRDVLLDALAETAIGEMRARITAAELDSVSVAEGIARLARGFIAAGSKYVALMPTNPAGHKAASKNSQSEQRLAGPLLALFERGVAEGVLRSDLAPEVLLDMFGRLLLSAIDRVTRENVGVEQASAQITSVFLHGVLTPEPRG
jgi:TetR/AcrR family transcriptional regulator, mexCD-oprJ operon repressor